MKTTLPPMGGLSIKDLEFRNYDRITKVLSQLKGEYKINTTLSYTDFIFILEKKIGQLLTNPQLTLEQIFDLWKDQGIVRKAIMDDYITFYC